MALCPQDVYQACSLLEKQGMRLTLRNIRGHIGHGSLSTINKYLKSREFGEGIAKLDGSQGNESPLCTTKDINVHEDNLNEREPSMYTGQDSAAHNSNTPNVQPLHKHSDTSIMVKFTSVKQVILSIAVQTIASAFLCISAIISFFFQVEAMSKLIDVPVPSIFSIDFHHIAAGFTEGLLIFVAILWMKSGTASIRRTAGVLFWGIGLGSAVIMICGQEIGKIQLAKQVMESSYLGQQISELEDNIASQKSSQLLLLKQIDPEQPGSLAHRGYTGRVNQIVKEISKNNSLIQSSQKELVKLRSKPSSSRLVGSVTIINEIIRVMLLIITAFLVHVVFDTQIFGSRSSQASAKSSSFHQRSNSKGEDYVPTTGN